MTQDIVAKGDGMMDVLCKYKYIIGLLFALGVVVYLNKDKLKNLSLPGMASTTTNSIALTRNSSLLQKLKNAKLQ